MAKQVNTKIGVDSKEAQTKIDKLTASFNKLGKEAKNDSISKLGNSWKRTTSTIKGAGLGAVIAAEVKLLKQELQAIKDTAEAFNVQLKAETKLAQAAKNNPYMDGTGVKRLEEFAGQLQSISDYGDEELIPMMTELVASGRTEAQVMDIMSASIDVAASTTTAFSAQIAFAVAVPSRIAGAMPAKVIDWLPIPMICALSGRDSIRVATNRYHLPEQ